MTDIYVRMPGLTKIYGTVAGWLERVRINFFSRVFLSEKEKKKNRISAAMSIRAENAMKLYGNGILRLAYVHLHNWSDAEEILQDTLIRYMESKPDFADRKQEKAWLFKVATNLCWNKRKYNNVRKTDELDETLKLEEREDLSFVWEAVKTLPEKQREVMHLFYYEGYSTMEISTIVRRKESTVRSDLHRARGKLKDILKGEYDFEI